MNYKKINNIFKQTNKSYIPLSKTHCSVLLQYSSMSLKDYKEYKCTVNFNAILTKTSMLINDL